MKKYFIGLLVSAVVAVLFSSCVNQKDITYFNNIPDTSVYLLQNLKIPQQLIHVNDVLNVTIGGESEKTLQYINQYLGKTPGGGSSSGSGGTGLQFQVSSEGDIDLPKIGKIKVEGLTREQAKDTITEAYSQYLINPIITVQFNSFNYTIFGEVKSPNSYSASVQEINIFEALAHAGDITDYADLHDVKLIRDSGGVRKIISLDFTQKNILNSPYYYLNRNDILYIKSKGLRIATENVGRTATFVAGITSVIAIFFLIFKK